MRKITIGLIFLFLNSFSQVSLKSNNQINFTDNILLNKFIKKWLGKPYKLGGKTERGIDCSQFNKRLYKDVYKIELQNVCSKQWNETSRVPKDSLMVGDLVFFRSKISPSGWHCGTYIGKNLFVHSANHKEGVKISSLNESRYKNTYKGAGRKIF